MRFREGHDLDLHFFQQVIIQRQQYLDMNIDISSFAKELTEWTGLYASKYVLFLLNDNLNMI